ncbi:hypothetical protein [Ruminococcus sp.]|uniref:hypothetical protein n=1 Tax=Ruminococcus sp. TaxID=41978 RepID=UPI0025EE797B|nr:hypothetical protein [Ruminococcus sp.]
MTDNIKKAPNDKKLDLEQLDKVTGGGSSDQLNDSAQQTDFQNYSSNYQSIKDRLDRINNKLKTINKH